MRMRRVRTRAAGFTLLETIVALALLGSTGLALMAWITTNLTAASQLRENNARAQLKIAATQAIQWINPSNRPTGRLELGTLSVDWSAEPDGAPATSASLSGAGTGQFRVQLYAVRVTASDRATGVELEFPATLLGFRYTGVDRGGL